MYLKSFESIFLLLVGSFSRLIFIVLASRLTDPLNYGKFAILWSIVLLISTISTFNVQQVIVKYYKNKLNSSQCISNYFRDKGIKGSFIWSLLFIFLSLLYKAFINSEINLPNLLICSLLIFCISIIDIESSFKKALYIIRGYYLDREILPFLFGIIFLYIFYLNTNLNEYLILLSLFIGYLLTITINSREFIKNLFTTWDSDKNLKNPLIQNIINEGNNLSTFSSLAAIVKTFNDKLIVFTSALIAGEEIAGYTFNISKIAYISTIILSGFAPILAPSLARFKGDNLIRQISIIYQSIISSSYLLILPVVVYSISFPQQFMKQIFNQDSVIAANILIIALTSKVFANFAGTPGVVLQIKGGQKYEFNINLLNLCFQIIIAILCIYQLKNIYLYLILSEFTAIVSLYLKSIHGDKKYNIKSFDSSFLMVTFFQILLILVSRKYFNLNIIALYFLCLLLSYPMIKAIKRGIHCYKNGTIRI